MNIPMMTVSTKHISDVSHDLLDTHDDDDYVIIEKIRPHIRKQFKDGIIEIDTVEVYDGGFVITFNVFN